MTTKKHLIFLVGSFLLLFILIALSTVARADDPDIDPPTGPVNLVETEATENSISISWDASTDNTGVTGYNIYNGETLVDIITSTTYTFSNLSPGTQYTFGVAAKDAAENLSPPATVCCSTLLSEPTNVSAVAHTTAIDISWNAVNSAQSYEVKVNGNVVSGILTTSYTYRGLTPGGNYSVQVRGMSGNTSGIWSSVTTGTTTINTHVSGSISQNTSWSSDCSPYIIDSPVTIQQNVTLNIGQGTVIKSDKRNGASLIVSGTLNAVGTTENPVVFTSISDPLFGGSGATIYWYGININSSGTFNADNVKIRYAGASYSSSYYPCYALTDSGTLSLSNSEIINTYAYGIDINTTSKDLSLINNTIHYKSNFSSSDYNGVTFDSFAGGSLTFQNNTVIGDNNTKNFSMLIQLQYFYPTIINGMSGYNVYLKGSTLSHNTTLPGNQYQDSGDIIVSDGVTLTLDPGTVIRFGYCGSSPLTVTGALNAQGTAEKPVVITSASDTAYGGSGSTLYWSGININTTGVINANNIKIRYAGATYSGSSYTICNVINDNGSFSLSNSEITNTYGFCGINVDTTSKNLTLNNTTIHYNSNFSSGYGIKFTQYNGGTIDSQGSTIINDGTQGYQIQLYIDRFKPDAINGLSGNNKVLITYYSSATLTQNLTLPQNFYELYSNLTIPIDKTLTLNPGAVIRSNKRNGASIIVSGILNALGTNESPIVFTSTSDPAYGGSGGTIYWPGIDLNATGKINATYNKIKYAGANDSTTSYTGRDVIKVNGELNLSNSEIKNVWGGLVISIDTASKDLTFNNNNIHFSSTIDYGIRFSKYDGGVLTFNDNTIINDSIQGNQIDLYFNSFKPTTINGLSDYRIIIDYNGVVAQNLTLPRNVYQLTSSITIPSGLELSLAPGTVIRCNEGTGAAIIVSGTLNAIGTPDRPIVFTSIRDTSYGGSGSTIYWPGIDLNSTGKMNSEYIKIKYAGANKDTLGYTGGESILVNGELNFSNSEITNTYSFSPLYINTISKDINLRNNIIHYKSNSDVGSGVYFKKFDGGIITAEGNTIINDGTLGTPIYITIDDFRPSSIVGLSGYQDVLLTQGVGLTRDLILPRNSYRISVKLTIPSGTALTLQPGTVFKLIHQEGAAISVSGTLNAIGTIEEPIVFTSINDSVYGGDGNNTYWSGIDITSTGDAKIDYVKIRYAGASHNLPSDSSRYVINDSGKLSLKNSEITQIYSQGISIKTGGYDTLIEGNYISGILVMESQ